MGTRKPSITQEELLRWAGVAAATIGAKVTPHEEYEPDGLPAVYIGDVPLMAQRDEAGVYWSVNANDWDTYPDLEEALCSAVSAAAFSLAENALDLAGIREVQP